VARLEAQVGQARDQSGGEDRVGEVEEGVGAAGEAGEGNGAEGAQPLEGVGRGHAEG
jgi:hypothetical protein